MAQLKDLIVTGASRFLNNIYGNLKGNATSADKVNHGFTVFGVTFNGSSDERVTKADVSAALELDDTLKLIGKVDTRVTVLKEGSDVWNTDATDAGAHVVCLQAGEIYATQRHTVNSTATIGTETVNIVYYTPEVGDIVLQNDMEYICTKLRKDSSGKLTGSQWVALDTSGYWYTW